MKVTLDKRVECQKCGAHVLGTPSVANAWLVIHEKYACPERRIDVQKSKPEA